MLEICEKFWLEAARNTLGASAGASNEDVLEKIRPYVSELSDLFTTERPRVFRDYMSDARLLAAYGLFFFPQSMARAEFAARRLLGFCKRLDGDRPHNFRILDLGSGASPCGLAFANVLREKVPDAEVEIFAVDRSRAALDAGYRLAAKFSRRAMIHGRLCSQEHKSVDRTPDGSEARQGFTPKGVRATDCSLENNLPRIASQEIVFPKGANSPGGASDTVIPKPTESDSSTVARRRSPSSGSEEEPRDVRTGGASAWLSVKTQVADLRNWRGVADARYDFIILGWSLNEIAPANAPEGVEKALVLLKKLAPALSPDGALVVLEPALKETAERLQKVGDYFAVKRGLPFFRIAPELGDHTDPLLAEGGEMWNHEVRRWTPPASLEFLNRKLFREISVLKFSWCALAKSPLSLPPLPANHGEFLRLISPVEITKPALRFVAVNTRGEKLSIEIPTRGLSKSECKKLAAHWERGDIVAVAGTLTPVGKTPRPLERGGVGAGMFGCPSLQRLETKLRLAGTLVNVT